MGRKRTSVKKDLKLYVDETLIEKLNFLKVNKSILFTDAAKKVIEELEKENCNNLEE